MSQNRHFISEFCRWAGENGLPKNRRARLSTALQKASELQLPERDGNAEVVVRPLEDSNALSCNYESPEAWLYNNNYDALIAGVVTPDWGSGWKSVSRDKDIADIVSNFFHLATQYVARSRIASLIGAIALTYERSCEFRFAGLQKYRIGPGTPYSTVEYARDSSLRQEDSAPVGKSTGDSRKQREFATWVRAINGLDPYIHRAVYQYWKATALSEKYFWEEAITALDGITSIAAQFVQERLGVSSGPRRSVTSLLGLTPKDRDALDHLYNLRCDFGAHPSYSKWWDFAEMYDEDLDLLRDTSKRLLRQLCAAEIKNRVVEPFPTLWSSWFSQNAIMVLNSVWSMRIR